MRNLGKGLKHLVGLASVLLLALSLFGALAEARVTQIVITSRVLFADGMPFGSTGPYEKLRGKIVGEVDPSDPLNAVIFNLDKAPRNARGMVGYVVDFLIFKPVDMSKGNGKIFYGINNRGNTGAIRTFNDAVTGGNNPTTAADAGNGFLMRQGYTIVWSGWDVTAPPGGGRFTINVPVAKNAD